MLKARSSPSKAATSLKEILPIAKQEVWTSGYITKRLPTLCLSPLPNKNGIHFSDLGYGWLAMHWQQSVPKSLLSTEAQPALTLAGVRGARVDSLLQGEPWQGGASCAS